MALGGEFVGVKIQIQMGVSSQGVEVRRLCLLSTDRQNKGTIQDTPTSPCIHWSGFFMIRVHRTPLLASDVPPLSLSPRSSTLRTRSRTAYRVPRTAYRVPLGAGNDELCILA